MGYSTKQLTIVDSKHLAEYILVKGGAMSHLKLQKILFYVHAYHLAYFGETVITDRFEAWVHGPVSRKVFNMARDQSILHTEINYVQDEGEQRPEEVIHNTLTVDQVDLVNEVIEELSDLSGLQLEGMTHNEYPWQYARQGVGPADRCCVIIPNNLIRKYYSQQLNG